jgi:polyadenylate-binding protein 2
MPTSPTSNINLNLSFEEKMEVDARSVYIGNVDYAATAEELEQHFHGCGSINRCFTFAPVLSYFGFRTQPLSRDP